MTDEYSLTAKGLEAAATLNSERGTARFVSVLSHERDALAAKVDLLEIDLKTSQAECKVLRDMLSFNEDQSRLRDAEINNRISTYQHERDQAVRDLARSEARFENLFAMIVSTLQGFRAQGGELIKKATE